MVWQVQPSTALLSTTTSNTALTTTTSFSWFPWSDRLNLLSELHTLSSSLVLLTLRTTLCNHIPHFYALHCQDPAQVHTPWFWGTWHLDVGKDLEENKFAFRSHGVIQWLSVTAGSKSNQDSVSSKWNQFFSFQNPFACLPCIEKRLFKMLISQNLTGLWPFFPLWPCLEGFCYFLVLKKKKIREL